MKKMIAIATLFLLTGCASMDAAERKNAVAAHPEWSAKVREAVEKGEVYIGMTEDQVVASWGHTSEVTRSVGSWGTHEQWCYSGKYLYFDNGVLSSFQEVRE